jgi:hypothetical protein
MFTSATRGRAVAAPGAPEGSLTDDSIRRQVWTLLAGMYPKNAPAERRGAPRFAFPQLLSLTPSDAEGTPLGELPLVVVGKTLSERGLGFFHREALPYRNVIVSLETSNRELVSFLMDLTWCRFTQQGWYESGGRFLKVVSSPQPANAKGGNLQTSSESSATPPGATRTPESDLPDLYAVQELDESPRWDSN